jgi:hypothetical protein
MYVRAMPPNVSCTVVVPGCVALDPQPVDGEFDAYVGPPESVVAAAGGELDEVPHATASGDARQAAARAKRSRRMARARLRDPVQKSKGMVDRGNVLAERGKRPHYHFRSGN